MQFEYQRYTCQMALPGFTKRSQTLLKNAKVLIVGMGGLGCPAAQYLVAAGIGTVGIVDNDTVTLSNLHRQVLYTPEDIGIKKTDVAQKALQRQNPSISVIAYPLKITAQNVLSIIQEFDIIVDGTDNLTTKYLLNDACVLAQKPLVYGAIYQYEGHVAVLNTPNTDGTRTPHFRDLFPEAQDGAIPNCADGGVMPTLAGIVGSMQANEVIKYLIHAPDILTGRLWIINVLSGQSSIISIGSKSQVTISHISNNTDIPLISPDDLAKGIKKGLYELIDVRRKSEHQTFHLGGENIPLAQLKKQLGSLQFSKPVVCYCRSGERSARAVTMLKKVYPKQQFFSLDGGIQAWRKIDF